MFPISLLQLRWSHLHFIRIAAVQINFISRLIPVTDKDELDELVCSQHTGLHSSAVESTAALTQRPWVRIPLKPWRFFLIEITAAMITSPFQEISFHFYLSCWHRFTLLEIVKFSSFREGLLSGPSLKVSSKDCKDNVFSKGNDHVFNYLAV